MTVDNFASRTAFTRRLLYSRNVQAITRRAQPRATGQMPPVYTQGTQYSNYITKRAPNQFHNAHVTQRAAHALLRVSAAYTRVRGDWSKRGVYDARHRIRWLLIAAVTPSRQGRSNPLPREMSESTDGRNFLRVPLRRGAS